MQIEDTDKPETSVGKFWPQLRKLLLFQVKLYIDAIRDIVFSILSLGAFIIDLIQNKHGPGSQFERVLEMGRRTDNLINLFNHHDGADGAVVDELFDRVENRFKN